MLTVRVSDKLLSLNKSKSTEKDRQSPHTKIAELGSIFNEHYASLTIQ